MRFIFLFIIALLLAATAIAQDAAAHPPAAGPHGDAALKDSLEKRMRELKAQKQTGDQLATMLAYARLCGKTGRQTDFLDVSRAMAVLARQDNNPYMEAVALINMGVSFTDRNLLDSSFYFHYKALQIGQQLGHDSLIAESYACLSGIYSYRREFEKSLLYADKALEFAQKWKTSKELLVVCLGCKAIAHYTLKQYTGAIKAAESGLQLAREIDHHDYIVTLIMNLANNYVGLGRKAEARRYLAVLEREMPRYDISRFYFTHNMAMVGMAHWHLGDHKKAASILLKQLPAARELHYNNLVKRIYDTLSVIAESQQIYKDALAYKKLSQQYQLLVQKQTSDQLISEQEVRYQTAEKEKALSEQNLQLMQKDWQLQKNRYYVYYTVAGLIVALLLATLVYLRSRHKKQAHARELSSVQQQKELQLLQALTQGEERERSRIAKDLHDGVAGMLAAVKMHFSSMPMAETLAQTEGYRQGMKLLNEVTQEIRKTSHKLMPEVLLQHGLDEALRRYCNSVNNSKSLQIQYDSWGDIDRFTDSFELSVYRIVQELIQNVLKHSKASQALVQLTQQNKVLFICIEDNGVGFSGSGKADGMGLLSLQNRVTALNGKLELQTSAQSGVSAFLEFEISGLTKPAAAATTLRPAGYQP